MAFKKGNKLGKPPMKGEVRNPNGRPKKYITELRHLGPGYTKTQVMDTVNLMLSLTQDELIDICADINASALEKTLAKNISIGIFEGDMRNIWIAIERLWGKPTQDINIETTQIVHQVITLPDGNKLLL